MYMKKMIFLMLLACLSMCSTVCYAQACGEKLRAASELKRVGVASRDIGKLNQAVYLFRQVSQCDPDMRSRCNKEVNAINRIIKSLKPDLTVSSAEVRIPYQGGARQIDVVSSGKWSVDGHQDWCDIELFDNKSFAVKCLSVNNETRSKVTNLMVKNGSIFKSIKVIQEGRPEYVEVGAQSLSFPSQGTEDVVKVESNVNWDVSSVPSWCKVEKNDADSCIRIIVSPNDRVSERIDDIVIVTPSKSVTIKIYQGAGEEHLALSQNNLTIGAEGDVHYLKVYTDAANWFVGDFPTWMSVQRVGADSIRIECGKNIPNGESRYGSVQVRTERQTAGVMISQNPRYAQDLIFPDTKVVGGRNLSFGFNASYHVPFVSTSAGGDYVGSVLDYGLGTSAENASYKSAVGYSFGVFADMRLYKNFFLTAGVNFMQMKYQNEFNRKTTLIQPHGDYQYLKGEIYNAYKEEYTHTMLEVPLLASYRFKINDVSHLQLNLGPVLNFGLSAKMKFSGNSNSETMKLYNTATHQQVDANNYLHHTAVNTEFNLYQPCVYWEEMYTSGNDAPVPHHDQFQEAPFHKFNCGLRFGIAYEWAGLSLGLTYTQMLSNMANKNYWENERWTVLNVSDTTMKGYKHRLNSLEIKLAYTFRYFKRSKSNKSK